MSLSLCCNVLQLKVIELQLPITASLIRPAFPSTLESTVKKEVLSDLLLLYAPVLQIMVLCGTQTYKCFWESGQNAWG